MVSASQAQRRLLDLAHSTRPARIGKIILRTSDITSAILVFLYRVNYSLDPSLEGAAILYLCARCLCPSLIFLKWRESAWQNVEKGDKSTKGGSLDQGGPCSVVCGVGDCTADKWTVGPNLKAMRMQGYWTISAKKTIVQLRGTQEHKEFKDRATPFKNQKRFRAI